MDPFEREGGFATLFGIEPKFPYVLGSDGAGTIAAVGDDVKELKPGDRVYAFSLVNPKGGCYAEYRCYQSRRRLAHPWQIDEPAGRCDACGRDDCVSWLG